MKTIHRSEFFGWSLALLAGIFCVATENQASNNSGYFRRCLSAAVGPIVKVDVFTNTDDDSIEAKITLPAENSDEWITTTLRGSPMAVADETSWSIYKFNIHASTDIGIYDFGVSSVGEDDGIDGLDYPAFLRQKLSTGAWAVYILQCVYQQRTSW